MKIADMLDLRRERLRFGIDEKYMAGALRDLGVTIWWGALSLNETANIDTVRRIIVRPYFEIIQNRV